MKKIVLYGAFDRYNYGDNIMPMLFDAFINKYQSGLLESYKLDYASISDSNLEKYHCYKSKSINALTDELEEGSAIIVIGGEVLCARSHALFMHMQTSWTHNFLLKVFRKLCPSLFYSFAKLQYSTRWEFPYLPSQEAFRNKIKVIYNTVGGDLQNLSNVELKDVVRRLNSSDYLSVRDIRTEKELSQLNIQTHLSPDSAYIMSDLFTDGELVSKVKNELIVCTASEYIVFQAAPAKVACDIETLSTIISNLYQETNKKVLLLPIGYASGHDDYYLLKKINAVLTKETILVHDLNVWEIMYVIKHASMFFGTSLHGVITAMSYGVPHFGINPNITKLNAFLSDWSVAPFNKCYPVENLLDLPSLINSQSINELARKTSENIKKVKENNLRILETICNDL
ncbi:hypothetical protein tinsulaeT_09200 [Thalassotalea insulae]|uniref:Polysaccharide pyruvyl transferase domain-containing protein n=1 Tax=Thalassotalea insulae TaxID=2056778 RepID=A0ABQ6GNL0_9GAMM|nr:polysaccharide pyruvyl transferase family protein [Thalassotalea insulae]GLX77580.1 hypothetical protein tinsulaeT_09200 [Thalassotalea insulae]